MSEGNNKNQSEKQPRRLDQQQYDMLKRCSDKKDMTEWNNWRLEHSDEDIWLQGGDFKGWFLKGVYLDFGYFYGGNGLSHSFTGKVHLEGVDFREAHLEDALFQLAYLQGACLCDAHLENANLQQAHLENAELISARLEGAVIIEAHLEDAHLIGAYLNGASLILAILKGAVLAGANIKGVNFHRANLQGANFHLAIADGETLIWDCTVNKHNSRNKGTDFSGVGLDSIRIDPATKQLLEYNIRRMNWEEWYKKRWLLKWPVRLFWCFSDYGISTWWIIGWFFGLALIFAAIYTNCACWFPPGIVNNLDVEPHLPIWHYFLLLLLRPIYFSVVTMTTGFSNMYANAQSIWGHILIGLQVLLGYVLLGALVTRFAVLFTAGGPAGRFADEGKKDADDKVS